ncbi:MAG: hypothetical protein WCF03_19310 [Nitrososphaeraceae archaeon]
MIQGAQISNSFILLMVLNEATQPLSTTKISELISKRSKGQIYKISATVRDSLQYRLKREGYVEGVEVKDKSLYSITPKGKKDRNMPKFDYTDIAATHKIMKRDVGIAYIAMRKIQHNVMRFKSSQVQEFL